MSERETTLNELVGLSRWLGAPERDCVILAEGNTSASLGEGGAFLVKASGRRLEAIGPDGFVEVRRDEVLAVLEEAPGDPASLRKRLAAAKADPGAPGAPSIETPLHAVCLGLPGVRFIGHTHPTEINALVCSAGFDETLDRSVYPDQVSACGPRSLRVPFADPGVALGQRLLAVLPPYLDRWGEPPQTIYLRNHGFVALGATAEQVIGVTQMAIKAARVLAGASAFGGPHEVGLPGADPHH